MRLLDIAACLVALAALAAPAAAADPVRVALYPVIVHSSESEADYLSAGLASMLSSRLEQFDDLAVLRLDDPKATSDRKAAVDAARGAGAEFVVYGAFTQFGQGASLDLQCARVADEPGSSRRVFVQSGTLGEIIPKLDELAEKIHRYVRGGPRASAASGDASDAGDLTSLERRVEALERTVYRSGPEQGPTAPPTAKPPAAGGAARPR